MIYFHAYIKALLNTVRKRLIHSIINITRKSPIRIGDRLTEKILSIAICKKARSNADMIASMRKRNPKKP